MSIDDKKRNKVWSKYHGKKYSAFDPFGNKITKNSFVIDHIYPESKGGSDDIRNLFPMSKNPNLKKGDDLSGKINKNSFKVKRYKDNGDIIGILYVNKKKISL